MANARTQSKQMNSISRQHSNAEHWTVSCRESVGAGIIDENEKCEFNDSSLWFTNEMPAKRAKAKCIEVQGTEIADFSTLYFVIWSGLYGCAKEFDVIVFSQNSTTEWFALKHSH